MTDQPLTETAAETAAVAIPTGDAGGRGRVARRAELTARAESYARGARADSTWAAYERQWGRFEAWCVEVGETALPADPLAVARFLADLAPVWRAAVPGDRPDSVVAGQVRVREGCARAPSPGMSRQSQWCTRPLNTPTPPSPRRYAGPWPVSAGTPASRRSPAARRRAVTTSPTTADPGTGD